MTPEPTPRHRSAPPSEPLRTVAKPHPHAAGTTPVLSRRELIKLAVASALATYQGARSPALVDAGNPEADAVSGAASAPQFFTPEEFALLDEVTELIIPTDEHSPGARAAGVAAYIDRRLAEAWEQEQRDLWRQGLQRLNTLSQAWHQQDFLQATPEQRIAILVHISQHEDNPQTPDEVFFGKLKWRTAQAYYTSAIGIHQELKYKGNSYLSEFVGYDAR